MLAPLFDHLVALLGVIEYAAGEIDREGYMCSKGMIERLHDNSWKIGHDVPRVVAYILLCLLYSCCTWSVQSSVFCTYLFSLLSKLSFLI